MTDGFDTESLVVTLDVFSLCINGVGVDGVLAGIWEGSITDYYTLETDTLQWIFRWMSTIIYMVVSLLFSIKYNTK